MSEKVSGGPSTPRKEEDLPLRISTQPGCALAPQGHSLFVVFENARFLATDKNLLDEHRKAGRFIQRCFWCRTNPGRQSGAHRCLGQSPSSFSCSIISQAVTRVASLRWAGEAQETVTLRKRAAAWWGCLALCLTLVSVLSAGNSGGEERTVRTLEWQRSEFTSFCLQLAVRRF